MIQIFFYRTMSLAICELLLQPDESRFVMFPVKRTDVWYLYKKSIDCFRKAEDIDLSRDYVDWCGTYTYLPATPTPNRANKAYGERNHAFLATASGSNLPFSRVTPNMISFHI